MADYGSTGGSRHRRVHSDDGAATDQTPLLTAHAHATGTDSLLRPTTPLSSHPLTSPLLETPTGSTLGTPTSGRTLAPSSSAGSLRKMPEPEVQPVLPDSPFTRELKPPSLHSYLAETLQAPYTTPFLLTITFSTAVLDSMTYNRFETFASNQTGNTVFLALAALHAGQRKMTLTLTSFAGFVASGLLFGQLGAYFGHRRRAWVLSSLVFQVVVLSTFTILASPHAHPDFEKNGRYEWCLMLLAAVQTMLTSPIAGLLSDPDLFVLRRAPNRDKRLVYVITFIVGAHVGLASDMIFSQWTTAVLALCLKAAAFVIAVRIPGTRTSVLKRQAEAEANAQAAAARDNAQGRIQ